jgi:hypothetical protein
VINRVQFLLLAGLCGFWLAVGEIAGCAAQGSTDKDSLQTWPCALEESKRFSVTTHLSSEEILARVVKRSKIVRPSDANFTGTVDLDVFVGADGRVLCARVVRGQPLATTPVLQSLKTWKFRPLRTANRERLSFYGTVTVPLS